jgi:nitrate reductase NapE component
MPTQARNAYYMKTSIVESRQSWFMRNRMTVLTVAIVAAYGLFIQWLLSSGSGPMSARVR